jgi:hypothetical protein
MAEGFFHIPGQKSTGASLHSGAFLGAILGTKGQKSVMGRYLGPEGISAEMGKKR